MSSTKLSHSQISKFQICPKSYEYHYVNRIRPEVTSAALLFGSALDAALNVVLTDDKPGEAENVFEKSFTYADINSTKTYIPTCNKVVYANSDFDADLLSQDDYTFVAELLQATHGEGYPDLMAAYKTVRDAKESSGLDSLSTKERCLYSLMNWCSSRRKGLLMLAAYRKKVMPKIEQVHSIQEYVSLSNELGDKIIGYVDLVATVKGIGKVILDNKTSAREYAEDSVLTSPQLALYVHMLEQKYGTRKAGYIVMRKSIIKNRKKVCATCGYDGSGARHKTCSNVVGGVRCNGEWNETIDPDVYIQIIVDDIPDQTEQIVMENTDVINESIKRSSFPRNLNSCNNYFGGSCPYLGLCYKNDLKGLVDMNRSEDGK